MMPETAWRTCQTTIQEPDTARDRVFPCEVWYPATAQHAGHDLAPETQDHFADPATGTRRVQAAVRAASPRPGTYPLVVFSHYSGGGRRSATLLCAHLSSHGYVVAALDHSEVVAEELARGAGDTAAQRAARVDAWIANRVPDIRFLLDHLLDGDGWGSPAALDPARVGIVGHSFGGWTALAAPDVGAVLGEQAHLLVRGLTVCHLDATIRREWWAQHLLSSDIEALLADRGVEATVHSP